MAAQQLVLALTRWVVFVFLISLGATVATGVINGGINTEHLFWGMRKDGTRYFSPGRVQLFWFTVGAAIYYFNAVMSTWQSGTLPDVPREVLLALAGSHSVYLCGKASAMLMSSVAPGRRP